MNILLIIPCNTGTIASVSHNLYLGLRKQAGVKVYTACLGEYEDSGYQFEDIFKLGQGKQGILSKLKSRIFKLRKIKKENNVHLSIATLWGCAQQFQGKKDWRFPHSSVSNEVSRPHILLATLIGKYVSDT